MSDNIINTLGHHTFKYTPPQFTESGAPCMSVMTPKEINGKKIINYPFLGNGYYFWDYNIARAHKWGESHYGGDYKVLEVPMTLRGEKFLDLVGSRKDLEFFQSAFNKFKSINPNLTIGKFFHAMQAVEMKYPGTWPFTIVRAMNIKGNAKKESFNHLPDSKMLLNPEIIICFYDKNEINLQNKRVL